MTPVPPAIAPPEPAAPPRRRRGVSIAFVLAATLSGLVFLAVASVIAINFSSGRSNTIELLRDRGELAVSAIEAQVRSQLDTAAAELVYLAGVIGNAADPIDDTQRVADLLTGAQAATPQIARLVFVTTQLQTIAVGRADGRATTRIIDDSTNLLVRRDLALAERHEGGWWTVLDPRGGGVALFSRHHAVRRGAEFIGELIALVSVRELSTMLPTVTTGEAVGRSFVLYDRDYVLAHPRLLLPVPGLSAQRPLPGINEVDDPVLAAIWDRPASVPLLGRRSGFHVVDVAGAPHVYLYRQLDGYGDKPLLVGAWFRGEDLFGELRRLGFATGAGFLILVVSVLAAIVLGRKLARPIKQLAAAAGRLRYLEFSKMQNLPGSRVRELDEQSRAFNDMLVGLRWFEAYVPRPLVRHLLRQGSGRKFPSVERQMTVMFTDIVGFTSLAEHRSAADTADLLNHHFALVTQAIEAQDGTVDKFIGDGAMAFWNAPRRHNDHPRRAALAALDIAQAIRADNRDRAVRGLAPIRMRIGIHTGPVVVGNIGPVRRLNYTIVGDTVNTAQRIEQLARDMHLNGEDVVILVSDETGAQLGDEFDCAPVGRFSVRGRAEGVEVLRLWAKGTAPAVLPQPAVHAAGS
jgi:adenylate cyclase